MASYYQTDKSFLEIKEILKGTLNPRFVEKQNLTEKQIDVVADHHAHLHILFAKIEALDPKTDDLHEYVDLVEQIEFSLQEAWGFELDRNNHTWWYRVPHCSCPKMDNEDMIGTEFRTFSADCPVHGAVNVTDNIALD